MDHNVFEQMAKRYDSEDRIALAEVIVKEVKPILRHSQTESLLDYGSGTGLVSLELAPLVDSVILVDASEKMLEVAKAKIDYKEMTNATVFHADFTTETPTLKADIVLVSLVLLHIPDTKKNLQALYHILNDGGKLIMIDFDKNDQVDHPKIHPGFLHEELKEMLSDVGFTSIDIRTFHHGKQIFAKQDASIFISSSTK